VGERHLKLGLCAPEGRGQFDAIAFNFCDGADQSVPLPTGPVRLVYRLDSNEYMGERRLQFVIEHLLPA
jgi:single-stranded-DNA-specific exonuclease